MFMKFQDIRRYFIIMQLYHLIVSALTVIQS